MFNIVDVDTMLMKRRQKFFDGYEHLDNLLCQNNRVIQLYLGRSSFLLLSTLLLQGMHYDIISWISCFTYCITEDMMSRDSMLLRYPYHRYVIEIAKR